MYAFHNLFHIKQNLISIQEIKLKEIVIYLKKFYLDVFTNYKTSEMHFSLFLTKQKINTKWYVICDKLCKQPEIPILYERLLIRAMIEKSEWRNDIITNYCCSVPRGL